MLNKYKNKIFVGLGFASIVYVIIIILTDYTKIVDSFSKFPIKIFLLAQFLVVVAVLLKFFRWTIYLKELKIELAQKDSFLVFISGLIMSITPGKIGELFKSFLISEKYDIKISKSASVITAERIIEILALIILVLLGTIYFNIGYGFLSVTFILLISTLVLIFNSTLKNYIINLFSKIVYFKRFISDFVQFNDSLSVLFNKLIFFKTLLLSIFIWLIECWVFFLIVKEFSADVSFIWSGFYYTGTILIGSISMLPAGLGATEGLMIYILTQQRIFGNEAVAITFLIRIVTLWIPIVIGFFALLLYLRSVKKNDKK